jgi:phage shock protein A
MDSIAVSEGDDLDRQLSAISKKTEVDSALEALKARMGEASVPEAGAPKAKEKVSSAFDEK